MCVFTSENISLFRSFENAFYYISIESTCIFLVKYIFICSVVAVDILNVVLFSVIFFFHYILQLIAAYIKLSYHIKKIYPQKAAGRVHSCGDLEGWDSWGGEASLWGSHK